MHAAITALSAPVQVPEVTKKCSPLVATPERRANSPMSSQLLAMVLSSAQEAQVGCRADENGLDFKRPFDLQDVIFQNRSSLAEAQPWTAPLTPPPPPPQHCAVSLSEQPTSVPNTALA